MIQLPGQTFNYGNGWIDPAKDYHRFVVNETGIYRVYADDLLAAGIDTTGMNPDNLHLMYRGKEQHIYVNRAGNSIGYIEFFGQRNDGRHDVDLYRDPYSSLAAADIHPNIEVGQFSDQSTYYFYADNTPSARPMINQPQSGLWSVNSGSIWHESRLDYGPGQTGTQFLTETTSLYDPFHSLNPHWTIAEGYVGEAFDFNNPLEVTLPTPGYFDPSSIPTSVVEVRVKGQSSWQHIIEIEIDGVPAYRDTMLGVHVKTHRFHLDSALADSTRITCRALGTQNNNTDENYLLSAAIQYYKDTDLRGGGTFETQHFGQNFAVWYRMLNADIDSTCVMWDTTNQARCPGIAAADTAIVLVPVWWGNVDQIIFSTDRSLKSPGILAGSGMANYSAPNAGADYVVIAPRELANSATAYTMFRDTSSNLPLDAKVYFLDSIYHEFGYGSPTPLAVKRFCKNALDNWATTPSHFLLWGKGRKEMRDVENLLPIYGNPPSDWLYISDFLPDSTTDDLPMASIGRVSVFEEQEGYDYLAKMQAYEEVIAKAAQQPWLRNGVFLSGGNDTVEQVRIKLYAEQDFIPEFESAPELGRGLHYWNLGMSLDSNAAISAQTAIDSGAQIISLFGNDNPFNYDTHLGEPTSYGNGNRMPLVLSLTGNHHADFSAPGHSFSERWLLHPNGGAIAYLGNSMPGFLNPLGNYGRGFFQAAFSQTTSANLGTQVRQTLSEYDSIYPGSQVHRVTWRTMNLQGDPALRLPDFQFSVWPGDANDDRLADVFDLLPIGIAYNDSGPARPAVSTAWIATPAPLWNTSFPAGANYAHADCNGDGRIDDLDTLAISQNYGLSHTKTHGSLEGAETDPALFVEAAVDTLPGGTQNVLYIHLGDSMQPADSVHGIAFSLYYDANLVDSLTTISFDSCWIGQDLITMFRHFPDAHRIDVGITRKDQQAISGFGVIAHLGIVVIDNVSGKQQGGWVPLNFRPTRALLVDAQGAPLPLRGETTSFAVWDEAADPNLSPGQPYQVYPNPVQDLVSIQSTARGPVDVALYNAAGQRLHAGTYPAGAPVRLDMTDLPAGIYLLRLNSDVGAETVKLRLD